MVINTKILHGRRKCLHFGLYKVIYAIFVKRDLKNAVK